MKCKLINYNLLLTVLFLLIDYAAFAQQENTATIAPYLKNGQKVNTTLRLGYRGEVNSYVVITMKFRISATGELDSLLISDNAPKEFVDSAKVQLTRLNGSWVPQKRNGKAVLSKWLVSHYYIAGFREDNSLCLARLETVFFEAFRREEELFLCDKKIERPLKCLVDFIDASQYYLLPPLLSNTVH